MLKLYSKNKLVYGHGINDANYIVFPDDEGKRSICVYYMRWSNMLKRCYISNNKQPAYKGCTVCDEWLYFMNFKSWMKKQDWKDKHLDKDILVIGNKVYSPETCLFISKKINNLLNDSKSTRGLYPQGVCYDKERCRYQASISRNGKNKSLGRYETSEEASKAYKREKIIYILDVALQQKDLKLTMALVAHANILRIAS